MDLKLPPEAFVPGRVYGLEWPLETVARRLRFEADRGFLRGVDLREEAQYRKKCSARHVPTHSSVILTRDNLAGNPLDYHASICFIGENQPALGRRDRGAVAYRALALLRGSFPSANGGKCGRVAAIPGPTSELEKAIAYAEKNGLVLDDHVQPSTVTRTTDRFLHQPLDHRFDLRVGRISKTSL